MKTEPTADEFEVLAAIATGPDVVDWKAKFAMLHARYKALEGVYREASEVYERDLEALRSQLADPLAAILAQAREAFADLKEPEDDEVTIGEIKWDHNGRVCVYFRGPWAFGCGMTFDESLQSAVDSLRKARLKVETDKALAVDISTGSLAGPDSQG